VIAANLSAIPAYEEWREAARNMLSIAAAPEDVVWRTQGASDLFACAPTPNLQPTKPLFVSRAFIDLARKAVLHTDPERFALLYRALWRLQRNRELCQDAADADIARLNAMAKAVRRDEHKMHAFVRFKEIETPDGPRFIAWFEPQFHIVDETADFFVRRFAGMRWSIITPEASLHWDGERLSRGPGGVRSDVPPDDARDADWRAYYESMFNPARLKVAAMTREMPKHYWKNLPEAQDISALIRAASSRADDMVAAEPTAPRKRAGAAHAKIAPEDLPERLTPVAEHANAPHSIEDLTRALKACRACPLWKDATQAVPGEGASDHPLLALVGEQPGDQEDLAGHPFIGPAGLVLDRTLEAAGIARREVFITNAVKHFKHEPRGKRRLHKRPDRSEVEMCRWWVKHELDLVQPRLIVALGVTALHSLSAHKGSLSAIRGEALETREGLAMRATIHPSALLRLPDEADKEAEFARFVQDLKDARAAALAG